MSTHQSETNGWTNERASGRNRGLGAACGLLGIVLVLLFLPIAQATSAGTNGTAIRAPFTGATGYGSTSVSASGCGSGRIVDHPSFDATKGGVGFAARAHATPCSPSFGDSGSASASETVLVPFSIVTGTTSIHAKWTVDAAMGSHVGAASCALSNATYSYCYASAYAELSAYAYVIDLTTGTYLFSHSYWAGALAESTFDASCYFGNCSSSFTGSQQVNVASNVIWSFRGLGLNPADSYELEVSWYATVSVYDYTYLATITGGSGSGWVAMAGPGFGATLDSINLR
jgi:hypothetical protein